MINSAEEFKNLRLSSDLEEQHRASNESADIKVWQQVITQYEELKEWVVHNKTIQLEILEALAYDSNPSIRYAVARKRKINDKIFDVLKNDTDESVRHALICNTKLSPEKKKNIKTDDSEWLRSALRDQNERHS